MGEEGVVGGGDEVARWAFRGDGADDLFKLDLDFFLDGSFGEEDGFFANVQLHIFRGFFPEIYRVKYRVDGSQFLLECHTLRMQSGLCRHWEGLLP